MDWFVKAFIKSSVAWLAAGLTLGAAMAIEPQWTAYRPAHLHMNLAGFVAMMIFGVAYHVVPRFVGVPLPQRQFAGAHWFIANVGLLLLVSGLALRISGSPIGELLLAAGGVLTAIGGYIFVYIVWRTLDAKSKVSVARGLPVMGGP